LIRSGKEEKKYIIGLIQKTLPIETTGHAKIMKGI
jgi:hypothetical protein